MIIVTANCQNTQPVHIHVRYFELYEKCVAYNLMIYFFYVYFELNWFSFLL